MQFVRVPKMGFDVQEARYYGWRFCAHIGYWMVFFGQMSAEELRAYDDALTPKEQKQP